MMYHPYSYRITIDENPIPLQWICVLRYLCLLFTKVLFETSFKSFQYNTDGRRLSNFSIKLILCSHYRSRCKGLCQNKKHEFDQYTKGCHFFAAHMALKYILFGICFKNYNFLNEEYFLKRPSDASLYTLSKLYDFPVGFVNIPLPASFEAMYCFICGCRGDRSTISDDLSCSHAVNYVYFRKPHAKRKVGSPICREFHKNMLNFVVSKVLYTIDRKTVVVMTLALFCKRY